MEISGQYMNVLVHEVGHALGYRDIHTGHTHADCVTNLEQVMCARHNANRPLAPTEADFAGLADGERGISWDSFAGRRYRGPPGLRHMGDDPRSIRTGRIRRQRPADAKRRRECEPLPAGSRGTDRQDRDHHGSPRQPERRPGERPSAPRRGPGSSSALTPAGTSQSPATRRSLPTSRTSPPSTWRCQHWSGRTGPAQRTRWPRSPTNSSGTATPGSTPVAGLTPGSTRPARTPPAWPQVSSTTIAGT